MLYISKQRHVRLILVCLFSLTAFTTVFAQPCSQTDINLLNQNNVDKFKQWYDCSTIVGRLFINGADITNLDSLDGLVEIGSLSINSTNIIDFRGLKSLKKINGTADISFNPSLTSFNGLEE